MFVNPIKAVCWVLSVSWIVAVSAAAAPIDVVLMLGQSNMVGGGDATELPTALQSPRDDVPFYYVINPDKPWDYEESGGLTTLRPRPLGLGRFGAEVTFGHAVADATTNDVAIIKVASNGTNLRTSWRKGAATGAHLYERMLTEAQTALGLLTDAGWTPRVTGVVWIQGSGDADEVKFATDYEDHLTAFIAHLREDFGQPDLAFVLNQYHIDSRRDTDAIAALRASQAAVAAADPLTSMVNLDDQELLNAGVHFTSAMHQAAGQRLAGAYLALVPEPGSAMLLTTGVFVVLLRRRTS